MRQRFRGRQGGRREPLRIWCCSTSRCPSSTASRFSSCWERTPRRWFSSPPTTSTRCERSRFTRWTTCSSRFRRERFAAGSRARRAPAAGRRASSGSRPARQFAARRSVYLERIAVRNGGQVEVVPVGQLDFIEAQDDYVRLAAGGRKLSKQSHPGRARDPARSAALRAGSSLVPAQPRTAGTHRALRQGQPGGHSARRLEAADQPRRLRAPARIPLVVF